MKSNKIIWGLISLLVLITVFVCSGSFPSSGQERTLRKTETSTPRPTLPDNRDLSKLGSVHYNSDGGSASEERRIANRRYDKLEWVYKTINNPQTAGVGRITEDPPPPLFPVEESSLIVTGEVVAVKAFLSNDRGGVYTEFEIKIQEVLKGIDSESKEKIVADREGGVVIYPNGQRVLYQGSERALPQLGSRYLLFLIKNGESPNHEILVSYDITGSKVYQLELGRSFDEFENVDKASFLNTVRNKVSRKQ